MQPDKARLKVGVLFGGRSAEHEVSILSARNVLAALDPAIFEAVPIAITRDGRWLLQSAERMLREKGDPRVAQIDGGGREVTLFDRSARAASHAAFDSVANVSFDVIVPIAHGSMGEDGSLQGLLEMSGIPYVGAGVLGAAVGMDKDVMKRLLREAGLPVGKFKSMRYHDYAKHPTAILRALESFVFPVFVKPANLGSSVGVARVGSRSQLPSALDAAFAYDTKVVVEEGIEGREIECSVLGNDEPVASIPGEIVVNHPDGFYSYDAKYLDDGATLKIPAPLAADQVREVQQLSLATFAALECSGMARVDFFLRPNGEWLINEINTLPGFTAISMYPKLWAASGVPPRELLTRLIDLALARHAKRRSLRTMPTLRRVAQRTIG